MNNVHRSLVAGSLTLVFFVMALLYSCKYDKGTALYSSSGYPTAIAQIMVTKCAISGCHNAQSYQNSSAIQLDTWDHLFNGSTHGAVVIPYDPDNSSLLFFINTDSTLGPVQTPTMPENGAPLSREEYLAIRDWIAAGAPDINGKIPFSDNPDTRQKVYMAAQGCDVLHVIDAERKVIMRNVAVGTKAGIDAPHCIQVSSDSRYAYICHIAGDYVQKLDTRTDQIIGQALVTVGANEPSWTNLQLSADGSKAVVTDFNNGVLKFINTATMQVTDTFSGNHLFVNPYAIAASPAFDTFYITEQYGNTICKVTKSGFFKKITIDSDPQNYIPNKRDPHQIMLTPDGSKYFVTCEASNEIRVMDAHTDQLLAVINTPQKPQEIAIAPSKGYMLVTCTEAVQSTTARRGAVLVIDYNTLQAVGTPIYGDFFQPYGIAVDEKSHQFYVASINADPAGPKPHHVSPCGRKNGWYSVYDLNTLTPINDIRYETTVWPYSAAVRFK